jgi:hypothetical protein
MQDRENTVVTKLRRVPWNKGKQIEQQRSDVKAAREAWFEGWRDLDPARLIFIDETSASTKMARFYGRAPKGERCLAAVPHGHWKTTTFTAGLRIAFRAYVEQILVATSRPAMWS